MPQSNAQIGGGCQRRAGCKLHEPFDSHAGVGCFGPYAKARRFRSEID
jgi:hypothetical protein